MVDGIEHNAGRLTRIIRALERMQDHAATRVERRQRAGDASQIEEAEYAALGVALEAIAYHRATLSPETSPTAILRELLDALDSGDTSKIDVLRFRGRHILDRLKAA